MAEDATQAGVSFSREQLLSLRMGQKLIDQRGGNWEVVSTIRELRSGALEFDVKYEGRAESETLRWTNGQLIETEEWAVNVDLNHPATRIE